MRTQRRSVLVLMMSLAFFALPFVSFAAESCAKEAKIARAMEAAPDSVTKNATIIDADGTVLRQGTNGWQCLPASAVGTYPMCIDEVWMRFMTAVPKKADFKTEKVGIAYMLAGDDNINNADPYDTKPDPGEVWVQEGPHLMIIVPDPAMLEGLPDDPYKGGPYVMWKGTPYAHIMIPVGPREK
ncbi:MAG: hypothetical protein PHO83_12800 [Geobacteraceae bacterium]|nr:hypothetical protein [Geobacteraceae bacterium]